MDPIKIGQFIALCRLSDQSVSFRSFDNALTEIAELAVRLKEFPTKEQAILFLIEETGESAALLQAGI